MPSTCEVKNTHSSALVGIAAVGPPPFETIAKHLDPQSSDSPGEIDPGLRGEQSAAPAPEATSIGADKAATNPLMTVGCRHLRDWLAAADRCRIGQKVALEDLTHPW